MITPEQTETLREVIDQGETLRDLQNERQIPYSKHKRHQKEMQMPGVWDEIH